MDGLPSVPLVKYSRGHFRKSWLETLDDQTLWCPRTRECFKDIEADQYFEYDLPFRGARCGQVLQHASKVLQLTLDRLSPMTFKIGFTHDPAFRFRNRTYGYVTSRDRWQGMIVVFASHDPIVASYVEAALILYFMGDWVELYIFLWLYRFIIYILFEVYSYIYIYVYISVFLDRSTDPTSFNKHPGP